MKFYQIYWAPEGRSIATVRAASKANALKQTPAPYNQAMGEVYAEGAHACVFLWGSTWKVEIGPPFEASASGFKTKEEAIEWARERAETVGLL